MTFYNEEKLKADIRKQLRIQRLQEVRESEKQISMQQTQYYQALKSHKKQFRQELIEKRRHQEESKRLKGLIQNWQQAVLSTGENIVSNMIQMTLLMND